MTPIVLLFAIPSVNLLDVIQAVLNQRTLFAMLNAKNQNVKLNAQIKDVLLSTAQNVLQSANNLIVLLTAKHPSLNVNQFAKNLNVTGNVLNLLALNPNVN